MFPTSATFFFQYKTKYTTASDKIVYRNKTFNETTGNYTKVKEIIEGSKTVPDGREVDPKGSINVLGIVVFSIVFGIVLFQCGRRQSLLLF